MKMLNRYFLKCESGCDRGTSVFPQPWNCQGRLFLALEGGYEPDLIALGTWTILHSGCQWLPVTASVAKLLRGWTVSIKVLWHLVTSCDILWHLVTSCDSHDLLIVQSSCSVSCPDVKVLGNDVFGGKDCMFTMFTCLPASLLSHRASPPPWTAQLLSLDVWISFGPFSITQVLHVQMVLPFTDASTDVKT